MENSEFLSSVLSGNYADVSRKLCLHNLFFTEKVYKFLKGFVEKYTFVKKRPDLLLNSLKRAANTEQGLINLDRLFTDIKEGGVPLGSLDLEMVYEKVDTLMVLFSSSLYLSDIFFKEPEFFVKCLNEGRIAGKNKLAKLEKSHSDTSPETAITSLRRYKNREILRIGLSDLLKTSETETVLGELSELANTCLDETYRIWNRYLTEKHGEPIESNTGLQSRFVVLGMGKLGGGELNFSSDVDLIYIYSSSNGETSKTGISIHEYFTKLARLISNTVNETSDEGMMYRVDLGLRPGGKESDIAVSIDFAELYYESWGHTWERQAMIKVCGVAGDIALGEEFQRMILPFVYRSTMDLGAIDEVRRMKDKINLKLKQKKDALLYNVKLGKGGIREIEFVVQAFQLLFGGKKAKLRTRKTIECIELLTEEKILSKEDAEALRQGYYFLRDLENRIQLNLAAQEHSIPKNLDERVFLARRMRIFCPSAEETEKKLLSLYKYHTSNVLLIYNTVFSSADVDESKADKQDVIMPDDGEKIFKDSKNVEAILGRLRDGTPLCYSTRTCKIRFDVLRPHIYEVCKSLPEPDLAVINFEKYAERYGAKELLFKFLAKKNNVLKLLFEIFGRSEFLTKIVCARPELVESILFSKELYKKKSRADIKEDLDTGSLAGDIESKSFEVLASEFFAYKTSEELKIGIQSLLGLCTITESFEQLSDLADSILAKALEVAITKVSYGHKAGLNTKLFRLAILGAGKLGGRELDFASDLDIFLVFESNPSFPEEIYQQELYIKVYRALFSLLSSSFKEVYKLDLDLRPDGKQGVLVSELSSFRKYYQKRAKTWERQAMIRSRFIAGDASVGKAAIKVLNDFSFSDSLSREKLQKIEKLREEMKKQRGKELIKQKDIKFGFGGLTEIEFAVQVLQLTYGHKNPSVRTGNTLDAMKALVESNIISNDYFYFLKDAYLFLRRIETNLRIVHDLPVNTFEVSGTNLEVLAKRINLKKTENILEKYSYHTSNVHRIYCDILGQT